MYEIINMNPLIFLVNWIISLLNSFELPHIIKKNNKIVVRTHYSCLNKFRETLQMKIEIHKENKIMIKEERKITLFPKKVLNFNYFHRQY